MASNRIIPLLFLLALVTAACGTSSDVATVDPPLRTEPETETAPYDPAVLEAARAEFDEAQARWESEGPRDYELVVSLPGLIEQRTTVVDGVAISSEVTDESGAAFELPDTVEEIFDDADALIAAAEQDPLVNFNQCTGHFFNVGYDEELGYPWGWDSFSPCDDGVAFMAEVIVS